MDVLRTLGVALGLGCLSGLNLYLTVFITGLALHMGWVILPPSLAGLDVLGNPIIIGIAGFLYLIEFFADKIPWIDTAWDSAHTFIRPFGAAALAVAAMGDAHPVFEVAAALLAGGMALTSHITKASTRLVANGSPEPISNIGLSLFEDGVVLGGLALIMWNPIVALVLALLFTAVTIAILPKLWRAIRTKLWLAWRKLNAPSEDKQESLPGNHLPKFYENTLRRSHSSKAPIRWAVPCVSGGGPRLCTNIRGWLVCLEDEPTPIFFVARRWAGGLLVEIDMREAIVRQRSGFLCDAIEITHQNDKSRYIFCFERGLEKVTHTIFESLQAQIEPEREHNIPLTLY